MLIARIIYGLPYKIVCSGKEEFYVNRTYYLFATVDAFPIMHAFPHHS